MSGSDGTSCYTGYDGRTNLRFSLRMFMFAGPEMRLRRRILNPDFLRMPSSCVVLAFTANSMLLHLMPMSLSKHPYPPRQCPLSGGKIGFLREISATRTSPVRFSAARAPPVHWGEAGRGCSGRKGHYPGRGTGRVLPGGRPGITRSA
jgi:hypothetical protein